MSNFVRSSVGGLLVKDNEILLLKRKKPIGEGKFSIVTGKVELYENHRMSLRREFNEEVDINVDILFPIGAVDDISTEHELHYVCNVFLVKLVSGIPKNLELDSHSEIRWFNLDDIIDNTMHYQTFTVPTIYAIKEYLKVLIKHKK